MVDSPLSHWRWGFFLVEYGACTCKILVSGWSALILVEYERKFLRWVVTPIFTRIRFRQIGSWEPHTRALTRYHTQSLTTTMLRWAIGFLIIALIAAVLGFGGIAGAATGIAKIIFVVFIILFGISLIFGRGSL